MRGRGFSLVEMLIVLLVIGILSATGAGFFANVTSDARLRACSDTLAAFFAACHSRAAQRGIPVEVEFQGNRLMASGSAALSCPIPPLDARSLEAIRGLRFGATQTFGKSGEPISRLPLAMIFPGGKLASFTLEIK